MLNISYWQFCFVRIRYLLFSIFLIKNYLTRCSICSQASSSSPFFDNSQTLSVLIPCYASWKPSGAKPAVISCDKNFLLNQNANFPCLMKCLLRFVSLVQVRVKYWQQRALTEASLFFWDRVSKVFISAWNCPACKTHCFPHKNSLLPVVFQPPPLFSPEQKTYPSWHWTVSTVSARDQDWPWSIHLTWLRPFSFPSFHFGIPDTQ